MFTLRVLELYRNGFSNAKLSFLMENQMANAVNTPTGAFSQHEKELLVELKQTMIIKLINQILK